MQCISAQGKMQSPLFSAAVKAAQSRQCVTAITPMEFCSSHRCVGSQHKCSAALLKAKCSPHCSVLLCKTGSKQAVCHCSHSCGVLLLYRCAVSQHKCSAVLFRAKCNPHCSVLLCKTGSKQAVCHCNHTYAGLLFTQVCREPAQMQCSCAQGKMQSPLFSVALQSRLKAGSFALHTGVQGASTNAVKLCSRQNAVPTVQCCPAKQAHSRQCVTAITPMEFCSSHRCAGSQHKCSAALLKAKCSPHCSVLL